MYKHSLHPCLKQIWIKVPRLRTGICPQPCVLNASGLWFSVCAHTSVSSFVQTRLIPSQLATSCTQSEERPYAESGRRLSMFSEDCLATDVVFDSCLFGARLVLRTFADVPPTLNCEMYLSLLVLSFVCDVCFRANFRFAPFWQILELLPLFVYRILWRLVSSSLSELVQKREPIRVGTATAPSLRCLTCCEFRSVAHSADKNSQSSPN